MPQAPLDDVHRDVGLEGQGGGAPALATARSNSSRASLESERVDQRVQQDVSVTEVARGESDRLARGELERSARGRRGPAVDVKPHAEPPAESRPSQADLDPNCAPVTIVYKRSPQPAPAEGKFAVVALVPRPPLESSHGRLERYVDDTAERP